ncbi:MAG: hypothetical protein ACOZNI_02515 [Myxococcota bacterium]
MRPNDGARKSRLALAREATGELPASPETAPFLAEVEAEKARVPAFDFAALQRRADDVVVPFRPRAWMWVAPVLALAAAVFLAIRAPEPGNRTKGVADLGFYLQRDGAVLPGDPSATFREGDRIQFTYRAPHDRLVLLSVDGEGRVSEYYPEAGGTGVPIVPGDRHVLEGSVILDDARGPEVFVGFFGEAWDVGRARAAAEEAFEEAGVDGLRALDEANGDVAVVVLEKE